VQPPSLTIRGLSIEPAIVLAPLESLTDITFRRLIGRIGGCGMLTTEFVSSEGFVRDVRRVEEIALIGPDEGLVAVQIYGRRPASLAEAARRLEARGVPLVDLNMGCPARKVCAHSGGASLMGDPSLVRDIVRAVRASVHLPLTCKMRAGLDASRRNAVEIARICEGEGADAVTVHGRTRAQMFGGECDLSVIADVRDAVAIPVIGNGDIVDAGSARRMLEVTGCHALMIGRGALRDPWLPLRVARDLEGRDAPEVGLELRRRFLLDYIEGIRERFETERGAVGRIKKFAGHFTHGIPEGARLRREIFHAGDFAELLERVGDFFDRDDGEGSPRPEAPAP
jgi:nifR3 family TIM-barrel protein